jgi:ATP-binding cassette subfamily B protein
MTKTGSTDIRELTTTALWAFRLIRRVSARLLFGSFWVMILRGILPALLALVVKELVDAVVAVIAGEAVASVLFPWLFATFALALLEGLSWLADGYLRRRLRDDLEMRVSIDVMEHANTLDLAFLEDPSKRDLIDRARSSSSGSRLAELVNACQTTLTMLIQAGSLLGVLIVIEPLVAVVVPLFSLPFLVLQWRLAKQRYEEEHERVTRRRWSHYYSELVTNPYAAPETRLLDLGPLLVERYRSLLVDFRDRDRRLQRKNLVGSSVATVLVLIALYGLFARVAFNVINGTSTVGDLAIFTGAAGRLRSAMDQAIRSATSALEQTLFVANLREFLRARSSIRSGSRELGGKCGGALLALDHVTFTYPGSSRPVISDVSLEIEAGETVAIVGENGAGKSTLVKLMARLYDPDEGRILFDGVDLRDLSLKGLHSQVSFVFQSFGRYEGTAAENIALGSWRELLDRPDLIAQIAREAGVDDLVAKLPDGYDTLLGRMFGQVSLSGGQWQQLAAARAYAREASLVVLDEPTSNLDARAEFEVFSRFKDLAADRTTILISHRFSTIAMADRIVVLADGRIREMGTHDELMRRGGPYAALYDLQRIQRTGSRPS